jgi:protease I
MSSAAGGAPSPSAKGWTALAAFIRECLKVLGTEIHHSEDASKAA